MHGQQYIKINHLCFCQPLHLPLPFFHISYSPFLPRFFLCVTSFWSDVSFMILVFLMDVFILVSYLKLLWFLSSFLRLVCAVFCVTCYLSSTLRVLLNSSRVELSVPENGLICTPKIPKFDRNSWRGFVDETCFFFSVQECMNTDQAAPLKFNLFCKKNCRRTFHRMDIFEWSYLVWI